MTKSGMRPSPLVILFAVTSIVGCQTAGSSQYAATRTDHSVIRTVKAERDVASKSPVVVLSQELESPETDASTSNANSSLWSKLRPTRFLLPRTDANTESEAVPATDQGLDDGF